MSRLIPLHASIKTKHTKKQSEKEELFCNCTMSWHLPQGANGEPRMTKICSEKSDFYGQVHQEHITWHISEICGLPERIN